MAVEGYCTVVVYIVYNIITTWIYIYIYIYMGI